MNKDLGTTTSSTLSNQPTGDQSVPTLMDSFCAFKSDSERQLTERSKPTPAGWRVVYGESRPAWEKILPTRREARAFAKEHESFGDIIFSIKKVVPGEPPQSMAAAIARAQGGAA